MKHFIGQSLQIFLFMNMTCLMLFGQKSAQEYVTEPSRDQQISIPFFRASSGNIVELFEVKFPPDNWRLINPNIGSLTFTHFSGANGPSMGGSRCVQMPFYSYGSQNHYDTLITPVLLNPQTDDSLFFEWAYQYYPSASYYDSLFVLLSTDGGLTFPISIFRRGGPSLATAGGSSGSFVPNNPSQWQRFAYPLNGLSQVAVAFVTFNRYGNNLYLDNIIVGRQKNYDLTISGIANIYPDTNYILGSTLIQLNPIIQIMNIGKMNVDSPSVITLSIPDIGYLQQQILNQINSSAMITLEYPGFSVPTGTEMHITVFTVNPLDEYTSNDTLHQRSLLYTGSLRSHVLYEQWTSSTCAPCASNNPTIDAFLMAHTDSTVAVKYHVGWPSPGNDPMYLHNPTQSYERRYYYGVNSVPQIWVDGLIQPVYPYTTAGSLLNPFIQRRNVSTPIAALTVTSNRPAPDSIRSVITVNILSPLMSQTYLRVQAVEKVIQYASPPGTNGEKTFYDVFRRAYPNTTGILLPLTPGIYEYTIDYRLDPVWIDTNMITIAFIQNDKTKEVYAAAKSGTTHYVAGVSENTENPFIFRLKPNYPNPFNPSTVLTYQLPEKSKVTLTIYNVLGQEVRTLVRGTQNPGYYKVIWDGLDAYGRAVSSGIYFYRLQAGAYVQTRKMTLIR